jgi:hypothetical protein
LYTFVTITLLQMRVWWYKISTGFVSHIQGGVYMKYSKLIVGGFLALLVQASASAQVYETEDAEGVPEFSDSPAPGAEVVDIPATNVMDAPAAEPADEAPAPSRPEQAMSEPDSFGAGQGEAVYYGGPDDEDVRAQRRLDEDRVERVMPGNDDRGVGAPGAGVEPHPAGPGTPEAMRAPGGEAVHEAHGGR